MSKKKSDNEKYIEIIRQNQAKEAYAKFLDEENRPRDANSAHLFALKKIGGGFEYLGMNERQLIILLAGKLPYMYD